MLKNVAIIPARGGSKRIPKKNIIDFAGKPLISWTIEAALLSKEFDRVIVSTDCEEIAAISESFGAEVPFLRKIDFDDNSPVSLATLNYTLKLQEYLDVSIEHVTQLMANCPLRTEIDIQNFIKQFHKSGSNFLLSCFKYGWMNPWWAFKIDKTGLHDFVFPDAINKRSQDLENLYCPTGSIWIAKVTELELAKTFYGKGHRFFEVPWRSAVDIDEYDDLDFALALLNGRK